MHENKYARKLTRIRYPALVPQVEKLTRVETNSRKVYKDMKKYIEDNNGLMKVETRLGEDFLTHAKTATDEGGWFIIMIEYPLSALWWWWWVGGGGGWR